MADVTDINGIGPAKAETLAGAGYTSVDEIAAADPNELAEVDGVGDDRALEFIVGAENLLDEEEAEEEPEGEAFDLTPAEVSEEVEKAEEEAESDSEEEEDESPSEEDAAPEEPPEEPDEDPVYEVTLSFAEKKEYDVFHAALMRHHERHYTGNQPVADAMEKCLDGLDSFTSVSYELTEGELNALHSAVLQIRTNYQGDNLIDHMDSAVVVLNQVNSEREAHLF